MRRLGAIMTVVALSTGCFPSLPKRPSSLDATDIRIGTGWLERTQLLEDVRLGAINQLLRRSSGELAIVGGRAALFMPARPGDARIVEFSGRFGEVELLDWPDGGIRYLDRGGGGWQTGALIGADGRVLWQPSAGFGMNDIAAGDVDGDGEPEFAVGYNGGGGVHLLDSAGRTRWHEDDGNVWHVEIVDTDADARPEIVHSNAAGEVTVRDASGKVLRRSATEGYLSQFSLVQWPPAQVSLLHAGDGMTRVVGFDGQVRRPFRTPDTTFLDDARGATVRLNEANHLVLIVIQSSWERTQLFVFDEVGTPRYREVLAGTCSALGVRRPDEFLLGCNGRVYRYAKADSKQAS
jgi:FG-GAP repeat